MNVVSAIAHGAGAKLQTAPAPIEVTAFTVQRDGRLLVRLDNGEAHVIVRRQEVPSHLRHMCAETALGHLVRLVDGRTVLAGAPYIRCERADGSIYYRQAGRE